MRTSSPQGTRGTKRAPRNRMASAVRPIAAVNGLMSPKEVAMDQARASTSPFSGGMPSRLGISPRTISRTRPNTNPVTIGLDMNSAAHPKRSRPPRIRTPPVASASAAVRPMAFSGSPPEMSATSVPDSTETVDTGPTTKRGDEPKTA